MGMLKQRFYIAKKVSKHFENIWNFVTNMSVLWRGVIRPGSKVEKVHKFK